MAMAWSPSHAHFNALDWYHSLAIIYATMNINACIAAANASMGAPRTRKYGVILPTLTLTASIPKRSFSFAFGSASPYNKLSLTN